MGTWQDAPRGLGVAGNVLCVHLNAHCSLSVSGGCRQHRGTFNKLGPALLVSKSPSAPTWPRQRRLLVCMLYNPGQHCSYVTAIIISMAGASLCASKRFCGDLTYSPPFAGQTFDAFPFPPYDIQTGFMRGLYQALEKGGVGLFESPTGERLMPANSTCTPCRNHKLQSCLTLPMPAQALARL